MKAFVLMLFMVMHMFLVGESQVKKANVTIVDYIGREASKTVRTQDIFYDKKGNKIREVMYRPSGQKEKEITYNYNEYGQIIDRREFLDAHEFFTETTFKYSNETTKVPYEMRQINSNGAVVFIVKTEFNDHGQPIKETWSDGGKEEMTSYTEFKYRDSLRSEELSYYDGELENRVIYQYDNQSRLIKKTEAQIGVYTQVTEIEYTDSLEIHRQRVVTAESETPTFTFSYSHGKRLIEEVGYSASGDIRSRRVLFYNDDNYVISEIQYKRGELVHKKNYEYEYY